jgi:HlyD family secretion protein
MTAGAWQPPLSNPKALEKGEKVAAQQVLLTLVAPGKLRAAMAVPEAKLAGVKTGQKATITPKMLPQNPYAGTVSRIAKTPAPLAGTTGYEVEIDLAGGADPKLAPGMTAAVKIDVEKVEGVLLVPASAVEGGKVKVLPPGEGKSEEEREVVTGRTDGKMIEIVKGLSEGERVVVK